jgi:hypothetical protein
MYLESPHTKPPLLDESVESNQACLDWLLHEVAYEHVHAARHMVGVTTGQEQQVTVVASTDTAAMWQKQFLHMPHSTLFVVPACILTPTHVTQVDPTGQHGTFVTFDTEVNVLVCVEDWVQSRGYVRLEDETHVLLVEWGGPTSIPLMPPRNHLVNFTASRDYTHISHQDLHALFAHLSFTVTLNSSSSTSCTATRLWLHPRLESHLRLFKRTATLETGDVPGLFHEVCKELAVRSLRQGVEAQQAHSVRARFHDQKRQKVGRSFLQPGC